MNTLNKIIRAGNMIADREAAFSCTALDAVGLPATPRTLALDWHKHAANDINLEYWTKRKDGGWPTDASLAAIISDHDPSAKTTAGATPRTDAAIQRRNFGSGDIDWVSVKHARTLERELSSAQTALAEAKAEVERLKEETVWGFHEEEETPQYGQGSKYAHEICSPITADEANAMVRRIVQLQAENTELRTMAAVASAGPGLYHDDGELQDTRSHPWIDWRRDPVAEIQRKLSERLFNTLKVSSPVISKP